MLYSQMLDPRQIEVGYRIMFRKCVKVPDIEYCNFWTINAKYIIVYIVYIKALPFLKPLWFQ